MKTERNLIKAEAVERLRRYYAYDEKTRTFTIPFHFASVDDILVDPSSVCAFPKITPEVLTRISDTLDTIPSGYFASIELIIDDPKGYDISTLERAFKDMAMERQFVGSTDTKSNFIKAGILTMIGVLVILLSYFGEVFRWWGSVDSLDHSIEYGFFNVFAVVFIWEAVGIVVIKRNAFLGRFRRFLRKAEGIRIKTGEGTDVFFPVEELGFTFSSYRLRAVSDYMIAFASFTLIGLSLVRVSYFLLASNIQQMEIITSSIMIALACAEGVLGILIYNGRVHLLWPCLIGSLALLAIVIVIFSHALVGNLAPSVIGSSAFTLAVTLAFIAGLAMKLFALKKALK